jgi:PTS system mannose-specific IIA component
VIGLLVVSHGRLAEELVEAVRTIVGSVDGLEAVSIGWDVEVTRATKLIVDAVRRVDRGAGVLILTDMFGGTPTNLGLSLYEHGRIEVVTGVNLPMLVKFTNLRGEFELHEVARRIASQGRDAIQVASSFLDVTGSREPRA